MKKSKIQRRTFWWTVFITMMVVGIMVLGVLYILGLMGDMMSSIVTAAPGQPEVTSAVKTFHTLEQYVMLFGMPLSFVIFIIMVCLIRLVYRTALRRETIPQKKTPSTKRTADTESEKAERRKRDQRLFLNLISVMQREGRLIDFFAENLDSYDDAQIGAAVREIHSTCRRVVEKRLSLKPVIQSMEGEKVTVDPGFDPGSIKLVGNVSGEPPFTGVLRHRGWQAGRMEMPTFSGDQDPGVIAPAEVEVQ
jgi:Na+-transporting methylmalonyl-CoA/oxaloacetate decarboxylase gamma subunit